MYLLSIMAILGIYVKFQGCQPITDPWDVRHILPTIWSHEINHSCRYILVPWILWANKCHVKIGPKPWENVQSSSTENISVPFDFKEVE